MDQHAETEPASPYLSIVVCSRNDDHGGGLVRRMQAFIDGLSEQSTRYGLSAELLIVEWNPPEHSPRLSSILRLPHEGSVLSIRMIEVPPSVHRLLAHSDALSLFQMIAKNVGIRAAKGRFVLATNVDILFSDELIRYLAEEQLQEGRYYRADRYDVPSDVLERGSIENQLAYCRRNVLRICKKESTIDYVTGTVLRIYPDSPGFRRIQWLLWAGGLLLVFNFLSIRYRFLFRRAFSSEGRQPRGASARRRIAETWRLLRATRLNFGARFPSVRPLVYLDALVGRLESLASRFFAGDIPVTLAHLSPRITQMVFDLLTLPPPSRPWLFTNASGDFTLMSKRDWTRVRGYPEMQMFSMHLDSLLLYVAYYSGVDEAYLSFPIYHIDHSKGWSPLNSGGFYEEIKRRGIPILSYEEFLELTDRMVKTKRPIILNGEDWGLSDRVLPEVMLHRRLSVPSHQERRGPERTRGGKVA